MRLKEVHYSIYKGLMMSMLTKNKKFVSFATVYSVMV